MENKRLEEIVELLWHTPGGWAELAAEDIKDLFAENERLRAELATKAGYDTWMRTAKALGRELDEATESEKRYHEAAQEWEHLCRAAESRLATAVGLLTNVCRQTHAADIGAFLASAQPAAPARHKPDCVGIDEERMCECDESLVEQLDEALCTLLHDGGEVGEHSPRTHLDLFYARQAQPAAPARADAFDDAWTDRNEIDEPAAPAREEQPDEGPDHGEADPNYPPHRKYFQPYRSLNSGCSAPLRRGLHQIVIKDGRKSCSLCGAGEPAVSAQVALEQLRSVGRAPARAEAENKEGK